jgi:hypothetical protein
MSANSDDLFDMLLKAPSGQINPSILPQVEKLLGKSVKEQFEGLTDIMNECSYYGEASSFAMVAMGVIQQVLKQMIETKNEN